MSSFPPPSQLNEERFLSLLEKLIGEAKYLQNSPSQGLIPKEDLAGNHIVDVLRPYTKENGGVLEIERISFVEGRGNMIIRYPGNGGKVCSFVGSHLDVVPANPAGWDRDPFVLIREGDMLYGRGTTDCLGHVAMLVDFMAILAETKPSLSSDIVVVFIANEENSSLKGIGIDQLVVEGYLEALKRGPLFWIDSADSQPCIGTAGMIQWKIDVTGKLFHSGLPHKGINAIEMAMDAVGYIQKRFYEEYKRDSREDDYNFTTQSTLKPTQISCTAGAINQLPPECTVRGDIRLSPFYDVSAVKKSIESYVEEINRNPQIIESPETHGPHSKYVLPDESRSGTVALSWLSDGENGIACDLTSQGFKALNEATKSVLGSSQPFSIGGSLPCVCQLKEEGFDVQISGYGFSSRYHADNEAVSLDAMKKAHEIMSKIVFNLEA